MGKIFSKVVTLKNCLEMRVNIKIDLRGIVCKEGNSRTTRDGLIGLSRTAVLGVTSA